MTINVGDKLPEAKFRVMTAEGPQVKTTDEIFKGKKGALFAVPGAYTGTCHKMHLPSIFLNAYALKDKGVNSIAIVSVNDAFVMNAWKRDTDQRDEAVFLADGNAEFTKAIGMELDASGNGLGIRSKRYSMLVEDGVALDPVPAHLMLVQRGIQPLPKIDVLDRLFIRGAPAVLFPTVDPAGDALPHILAVGVEIDLAGLVESFQR